MSGQVFEVMVVSENQDVLLPPDGNQTFVEEPNVIIESNMAPDELFKGDYTILYIVFPFITIFNVFCRF